MANVRYSLNLYNSDDEIVKTLESRGLLWGQLVDLFGRLSEGVSNDESVEFFEDLMLTVFPSASKEELRMAYFDDMASIVSQIMAMGRKNGLVSAKESPKN